MIPPAIHSFYFFDPNGIRLEISSDLDGDEEDLQVIRSCSMSENELRAELETISTGKAWVDDGGGDDVPRSGSSSTLCLLTAGHVAAHASSRTSPH